MYSTVVNLLITSSFCLQGCIERLFFRIQLLLFVFTCITEGTECTNCVRGCAWVGGCVGVNVCVVSVFSRSAVATKDMHSC